MLFSLRSQYLEGINQVALEYGMYPVAIAQGGEWWRLFTSAFLHGSFIHIAFNMYVLFFLGPTLERILGHARFTVLYLLAALGGSVASYWFSDLGTVSVGASGAIFGLMGALIVAGRRMRYDISQVLLLLAINVAIGFFSPRCRLACTFRRADCGCRSSHHHGVSAEKNPDTGPNCGRIGPGFHLGCAHHAAHQPNK